MRSVQELVGHQDLTMTQRYSNLSPAALIDTVRLLETRPVDSERGEILDTAEGRDQKLKSIVGWVLGTEFATGWSGRHEVHCVAGRCVFAPCRRWSVRTCPICVYKFRTADVRQFSRRGLPRSHLNFAVFALVVAADSDWRRAAGRALHDFVRRLQSLSAAPIQGRDHRRASGEDRPAIVHGRRSGLREEVERGGRGGRSPTGIEVERVAPGHCTSELGFRRFSIAGIAEPRSMRHGSSALVSGTHPVEEVGQLRWNGDVRKGTWREERTTCHDLTPGHQRRWSGCHVAAPICRIACGAPPHYDNAFDTQPLGRDAPAFDGVAREDSRRRRAAS